MLSGLFLEAAVVRPLNPSLVPSLTSIDYASMLGAGTDDTTAYHPLFDFCGRDRADRPDSLFCLYKPSTKHYEKTTQYLVWNGRVILDYKREPIRAFDIPLTISSKIGNEAARLEAMMRSDKRIRLSDILARILRRGVLSTQVKKYQHRLDMRLVRFRTQARLLSFDRCKKKLKNYLLSTMTPEMVAKNTTRGLADLIEGSDEKAFIDLLNKGSKKANDKSPRKRKHDKMLRRILKAQLTRADAWAQVLTAREAQIPTPAPSIHGDLDCTAIESIVAFKLASIRQYRRDGCLVFERAFMLDNAAPNYPFETPGMKEFFGGQMKSGGNGLADSNDPYGLLGSPTVTEAQSCLVDFLLEPARMQYTRLTLVNDGSGRYKPIFTTNPRESYWRQLQALQSAFGRTFREINPEDPGNPPELFGVLRLDHSSMVWNSDRVPILTLVKQSLERCRTTLARWQGEQREMYRANLCRLQGEGEEEKKDDGGSDEDEGQEDEMVEERADGKDDVETEGEVQEDGEDGEDELEDEEELF